MPRREVVQNLPRQCPGIARHVHGIGFHISKKTKCYLKYIKEYTMFCMRVVFEHVALKSYIERESASVFVPKKIFCDVFAVTCSKVGMIVVAGIGQ